MRTARKAIPRPTSRQTKSVLGPEGASTPPAFRPVQLATLVDAVPAGDRWIHEMKYDGYRILVAVGGGEAAPTHGRVSTGLTAFPQSCLKRVSSKDKEHVAGTTSARDVFEATQNAARA